MFIFFGMGFVRDFRFELKFMVEVLVLVFVVWDFKFFIVLLVVVSLFLSFVDDEVNRNNKFCSFVFFLIVLYLYKLKVNVFGFLLIVKVILFFINVIERFLFVNFFL